MTRPTPSPDYEALWPGGASAVPLVPPAPRPDSLSGKRIAFLWDSMFRGEEIFPALQAHIRSQFDDVEFISYEEFGSTFGGSEHAVLEALPERLQTLKVDAVISGNHQNYNIGD